MTYLRHSCSTYMEISTHSQVQWWHQQQTEWTLFCLPICHAPWLLVERALEGEDSACTGTRPYCSVRNARMAKVPCLLNVWIHSLGPAYFSSHWGDQIVRQQTWATKETLIEFFKMTLQMTRTYMFYFFIFNKKKMDPYELEHCRDLVLHICRSPPDYVISLPVLSKHITF